MKRLVNIRIPVVLALTLIAGILAGYLFICHEVDLFYIVAVIPFAAIFFIPFMLRRRYTLAIVTVIIALFLAIGAVNAYFRLDAFDSKALVSGDAYTVSATVCDKGEYDSGKFVIVKNLHINGHRTGGKIKVYLRDDYGEFCDVGYKVTFTSTIYAVDLFPYGKLNYNAVNDVRYTCTVSGGMLSEYRFTLFGNINSSIRNTLYDNLDYDTASIVYAMITGNTYGIDNATMTAFRYGGIAHLFAVSGLHIGIIYGIMFFIGKKLKLNKYLRFALCILPIFIHTGVCGFTVSSVRALIMCTISATSRIIYTKYDGLNGLAISAILILIINPLNLFAVGFQLSVCAIGGIILLSKNIARPLKKLPQKLTETISVSLGAQAGTMPVMLSSFGYISGAGLLLNIVLVPLLSTLFTVMFVATVLCIIFPFIAQYIIPIAALPLQATISFIVDSGFEKALIKGFGAGLFTAIYFAGALALSDKLNIKIWHRIAAVACAFIVACTYIPIKSYAPFNGHKIVTSAYYGGGEVLIKSNEGNILIITQGLNTSRLDGMLNEYYSCKLDAVIILGGEDCVAAYGTYNFKCDAYVYGAYIPIQPYRNKTVNYKFNFTINDINFTYADGYGIYIECDGVRIAVCAGNEINYADCNIVIGDCVVKDRNITHIAFNDSSAGYCIYDCGDYTFKTNGGTVK